MTTWVMRLIVANMVIFFLTLIVPGLYGALAFIPALVVRRPWTILTYMFLHASIGHILFNMLALYFLGPRVEARLGSRDFLLLYFLGGLGGAFLSFLLAPGSAVVGASGAVFGVLLAFARYWPRERLYIWGILPVEARWLVVGLALLSLYSGFAGAGGRIAHFAHLGGFVGGWAYLRWRERRIKARRPGPYGAPVRKRVPGQARREEERWRSIRLDALHEVNRAEVERILRKLDERGPRSITPTERAFMNRMSGA